MKTLKRSNLLKDKCYIGGEWVNSKSTLPVINPATGAVLGSVPACSQTEIQQAILAATEAGTRWKNLTAKKRSEYLWRFARKIQANKLDLATIITLEQGKPLTESLNEIDYATSFIEWFAEEGRRSYGDIIPANQPDRQIFVTKEPIGLVAAITPWNFPSAMIARKLAPALAAGCPIIIKPSEETPFSALALAALAEEAEIPKGIINVITGLPDEIGRALTTHPSVKKISFTGSTSVGKLLMQQSASTMKRLSLELGGNAPFIIFDDADITAAITGLMHAKFRNNGQTCIAPNRILVQDSIYQEVVEKLLQAMHTLQIGYGWEENTQLGPLINDKAVDKINNLIKDAVNKGAIIQCGGTSHSLGKLFYQPTLLTQVDLPMQIANEEVFGPVLPLYRFNNELEAITLANSTEMGLAGYFYTENLQRVWRVAKQLESGMLGINDTNISTEVAPFGGIKHSGMGREGSKYGIEDYLNLKYLCMSY